MATGGQKEIGYNLDNVGTLTLETADLDLWDIIVSREMLMITDGKTRKVHVYRRHDGMLLSTSDRLEAGPYGMCFMNEREICVALENGTIEFMSVDNTGRIKRGKQLNLQTTFDRCNRLGRFRDKIVACGVKNRTICWCIASLEDGHVDEVHNVCKGLGSFLTIKDTMMYISCYADFPDSCVYGYNILNPRQQPFTYKPEGVWIPAGITVDDKGFLFLCDINTCIHLLTDKCQLVTKYMEGIPRNPSGIFWDSGILYVTSLKSNVIHRYKALYPHQQGDHKTPEVSNEIKQPVIEETATKTQQEIVDKGQPSIETETPPSVQVPEDSEDDKQGDHKTPEVSNEIKQPVIEETATKTQQEIVDKGQPSIETETPPSVQVPEDSEDDKQDPVIPVEILRMDDKSLQLYKQALQDGKEKVYNIRVMVVGKFGVGKTTLTKRLLGQPVDISERKSTEGIDIHKHCCKISLDTGEWIAQPEDSYQLARLQRLVKLLTNQRERSEVSSELEGHREDIRPKHFSDSDDDDTPTSTNVIYHNDFSSIDDDDDDTPTSTNVIYHNDFSSIDDDDDDDDDTPTGTNVIYYNDFSSIDDDDDAPTSLESDIHQESDVTSPALEVSSVAILEKGRHVKSKGDAVIEFLQLVNEKADRLKKGIEEYATLSMWDFAGQYVFYTTHQTFLTRRAIYLLVTDLCQQFTDLVRDDECYFDTEGVRLCQVQDLVEVWLNSIHCCAPSLTASTLVTSPATGIMVTSPAAGITATSSAVGTSVTSSAAGITVTSPDAGIPVTPPVILVGTHVDKIQEDKRQEVVNMYFPQICRILNDKPALCHVVEFVPIDNTHVDHQLETLKERIFQLASEQPYWGEEVPSSWLPMEEALMKLKASGKKIIPRSLVEELNQAASVPIKSAEQLDLFLRFQHEMGTILYFSVDELKEKIVLDPQWFIDALKSLITAETFILKKYPTIRSKWFEFKDNGKLTPELIGAVWTKDNNPEFYENKEHMLVVMEKLNIIAKPKSYIENREESKEEEYYIAPCMLSNSTPKEIICPESNPQKESTSVLCFVSTGKFLPPPVFHRLLATCVSHWQIATQRQKRLIFCGCCVFDLDDHHRMTLHFKDYIIFARITRMGVTDIDRSSKLCSEARKFIFENLMNIIGNLGQTLQFELHIKCPDSDADSLEGLVAVSLLQKNEKVACHAHDNSHILASQDLLKFWFEEEQKQEIEQRESSGSEQDQEEGGQDNADTPITQEHINHARLCNALTTVCADALREILINQVPTPYANIYQAILANKANLTRKRLLNKDQFDIVFPDIQGRFTGTVDQFDTSLLYTIIRNVSSVPAPTTGWGNLPVDQPRDTSLGASVERIRFSRNKVSGHSVDGKISETEFKDYWKKIDDVLHDIESVIGVRGYQVELEKRKSQAITPHEAQQLQKQFQEYKKQVEDAKEKIRMAMEAVQNL